MFINSYKFVCLFVVLASSSLKVTSCKQCSFLELYKPDSINLFLYFLELNIVVRWRRVVDLTSLAANFNRFSK